MSLRKVEVSSIELRRELNRRLKKIAQADIARLLKIAAPLISNTAAGKINPTGKLLKWLGYERVVTYRKVA